MDHERLNTIHPIQSKGTVYIVAFCGLVWQPGVITQKLHNEQKIWVFDANFVQRFGTDDAVCL